MDYLSVTRFNTQTWKEYNQYREKHNINDACYSTPVKIKEEVLYHSTLYVFEMNNDNNLIMGIGMIVNTHSRGIKHNIYKNNNYNRYNYTGKIRLSREILCKKNKEFIHFMERLLFKSYKHYKRGSGIQVITDNKYRQLEEYNMSKQEVINIVKILFY